MNFKPVQFVCGKLLLFEKMKGKDKQKLKCPIKTQSFGKWNTGFNWDSMDDDHFMC